jgi:hypothetical protein
LEGKLSLLGRRLGIGWLVLRLSGDETRANARGCKKVEYAHARGKHAAAGKFPDFGFSVNTK